MADRAGLGALLEQGVDESGPETETVKKPKAQKKAPKAPPTKPQIAAVAREAGFDSREAPAAPADRPRGRGRRRSKNTVQFNCKISPDLLNRVVRLSDDLDCIYAETLERAVSALERELGYPGAG